MFAFAATMSTLGAFAAGNFARSFTFVAFVTLAAGFTTTFGCFYFFKLFRGS